MSDMKMDIYTAIATDQYPVVKLATFILAIGCAWLHTN